MIYFLNNYFSTQTSEEAGKVHKALTNEGIPYTKREYLNDGSKELLFIVQNPSHQARIFNEVFLLEVQSTQVNEMDTYEFKYLDKV